MTVLQVDVPHVLLDVDLVSSHPHRPEAICEKDHGSPGLSPADGAEMGQQNHREACIQVMGS